MPSGAKKRKAAKKKQNRESNINSATTSHENDDMKSQKSDGGEVSSPEYQDQHNHHEEKEQALPARQYVSENTSVEMVDNDEEDTQTLVVEDVDAVFVTREWCLEQDPENNDVNVEHVECEKKSHNRSSSSSSSSDYGSSSSDDESHMSSKGELVSDNLAVEHETVVDSDRLGEFVTEKVISCSESALLTTSNNFNVVGTEVNDEIIETLFSEIDNKSKVIDDQIFPLLCENGDAVSFSQNNDVIGENGDYAPILEDNTCEEHIKDSEFPECFEKQLLVAAAARQEQTTSWKGCCGLFEVLTGTKR